MASPVASPAGPLPAVRHRVVPFLPAVLLSALVLVPYWPVSGFDFLVYDDYSYVTNNPVVRSGLSLRGISWAFTTFHASNWHPLTWVSHMLDVELFGLDAGWHHRVNLSLHLANTLLLFGALRTMTGAAGRSFLVAALFGVHPLHVESVAWIAERKDVLSAFFWMLAMRAYAGYARRPAAGRYLAVVACFALGLLSKPMVVTLPFVLLLLDWWPLGRMTGGEESPGGRILPAPGRLPRLVLEKLPLVLLSALSSAVTYVAQWKGEAMNLSVPFAVKAQNALLAYVAYLGKTIRPVSLAILYPHPGPSVPPVHAIAAGTVLAALTAASVRYAGRRPHLAVGWFWYLGTLVPVIGLVQIGVHSIADRYTYIPLVGIFMAVSWEFHALCDRLRPRPLFPVAFQALSLSALVVLSAIQVRHWRNSVAVFRHALESTSNNWVAHLNLGWALEKEGRLGEATLHYRESLRIFPGNPYAHNNLGYVLGLRGETGEATYHFREALRLKPDYPHARRNLEALERTPFSPRPPGRPSRAEPGSGQDAGR